MVKPGGFRLFDRVKNGARAKSNVEGGEKTFFSFFLLPPAFFSRNVSESRLGWIFLGKQDTIHLKVELCRFMFFVWSLEQMYCRLLAVIYS